MSRHGIRKTSSSSVPIEDSRMSRTNHKGLEPGHIAFTVGMKVLASPNVQTDADLVNGIRD